ncbi:hypothetical protein TNCV_976781 [Trichonephila clavipes]|nr:hypothetical protein TNCV_976781 [Trichonephila clavipes]
MWTGVVIHKNEVRANCTHVKAQPASTPYQLSQYVEARWTAVTQGCIQNLIDSMPRHVAAVIANNGGYTNY